MAGLKGKNGSPGNMNIFKPGHPAASILSALCYQNQSQQRLCSDELLS
jgi:hypothetical protein